MSDQKKPTEEAYSELQFAFDFYNARLFDGKLPPCLITLQRQKKTLGYYSKSRFAHRDSRQTDEIAMNPEYFAVVPLIEILQTLVHEMTHQWQWHFGSPSRSGYHNAEWADKMESIGLAPSSTGQPGGKRVGQCMGDYPIRGGEFELATRDLLSDGFAISWFDRFPVAAPDRFAYAEEDISSSEDEMSANSPDPILASAYTIRAKVQPGYIENMKTGNRSNRSKYSCPDCDMNVWGKPGLRVSCIDCGKPLDEET